MKDTSSGSVRIYLATTSIVFGLIVVAHAVRVFSAGTRLLTEPDFVATTILAALLSLWGLNLFLKQK